MKTMHLAKKQCRDYLNKKKIKKDVHLVWQDAYPPAICVHILEIRRVKQSVLGFLCTYVCAQQFQKL
jgi:hypothetical protein